MVVDYGEDQALSNSIRGIKEHKLYKDQIDMLDLVGEIDLSAYVNFKQITEVAKMNKSLYVHDQAVPQG